MAIFLGFLCLVTIFLVLTFFLFYWGGCETISNFVFLQLWIFSWSTCYSQIMRGLKNHLARLRKSISISCHDSCIVHITRVHKLHYHIFVCILIHFYVCIVWYVWMLNCHEDHTGGLSTWQTNPSHSPKDFKH